MRIGIFGRAGDAQTAAMETGLKSAGADPVLIDCDGFDAGAPMSVHDSQYWLGADSLDDVLGYFIRSVPSPYAPFREQDDLLVLLADWHRQYMQSIERSAYFVSWLLSLRHRGAVVINPPQAASMLQYKPFQLEVLRSVGATVPRTLISNDPHRIARFADEVGDVIFKPVMGGAVTLPLDAEARGRLDAVKESPVIFQQRAKGEDLRVMLVGDRVVSCVAIVTDSQHLDFRDDPVYASGRASYREVVLPDPIARRCVAAARLCGLSFAGIDIKHHGDDFVFLELNSSPIYLDVELKLGHPITRTLCTHLVDQTRLARGRAGPAGHTV